VLDLFPADAVMRAREIKASTDPGGTGAYSHSQGVPSLRQDVADFINRRDECYPNDNDDDNVTCNPNHIFLTNGASAAIQMVLQMLVASTNTGVMLPIPQYPIYSATVDLLGGQKVGYYLDEEAGWELNMDELERAHREATERGIDVSSLVVINPGNPTGTVLSKQNLQDIVQFCARHNLVLLADEVYQENVYQGEFYSCRRAAYDTGLLGKMELVSFHSVSKGVFGECGRRGGYMELTGFDPAVLDELYKLASSTLCSTLSGQIMTSLMVRGPAPGDVSYVSHEAEKLAIYESLKRRSTIVSNGLNQIPGFHCQKASGSMYCFPAIDLPVNAVRQAAANGESPDSLYCKSLLQRTGICVVPASGFGQRKGRFGFRTTFLPSETEMERCVALIRRHYEEFCEFYS
jgi:aspartate/methionine/tyrosine aminotransferase